MTFLKILWKFSRPHTIIGTSLSVLALYFISLASTGNGVTTINLEQMLAVWFACICGNIYIVGLNQLYDIEIDRINKPDLPLASGEFTLQQGQLVVTITGVLALLIAGLSGVWLLATVAVSLLIGSAYSLPPIRLKQFPFFAAFCILTVRGIVVNIGLFLHYGDKLNSSEALNPYVWTLTLFILLFTVAIAIFKDVPDLEGDKQYNINTFTLVIGKPAVFNLSRGVISVCYLGTIAAGLFWLTSLNLSFFVTSHLVLLGLLWWRSRDVDLEDKSAIAKFYQFIWQLFFVEYLLFPIACFV
ncbi:homogentisate phytyltransferase [Waterburya agarophytonicola K14]|uniref:Homogentisate phytyltransferase n=1 Tax=Waterburya agarophytonicola KI4 TaxID=2874699 RepID=A0A964FF49_9CYAN|nr:homogentisate phytyltransferase [Waterburya agarophytonicola]MCC0176531.1 homogentisate phytyltransferase [Waterburya agarophytonicola KI4]